MLHLNSRIFLQQGDITNMQVDAIVNAANSSLMGGGGVDGVIHRKGGPQILAECKKLGGCPTGEAVITSAGKLPSKYIIHTVGPIWEGGKKGEHLLLQKAYKNSLELAVENEVSSIAFPNISTGVYGYPKISAARIALNTVQDFIRNNHVPAKVFFICYDLDNYNIYNSLMESLSMEG